MDLVFEDGLEVFDQFLSGIHDLFQLFFFGTEGVIDIHNRSDSDIN